MKTIIIDGVEYDLTPKALFKKGDWIYHEISGNAFHINKIKGGLYVSDESATISLGRQNDWRLWTVQDVKVGDVISFNDGHGNDCIELIKSITDKKIEFWFCLTNGNRYEIFDGITPYTNFASRESAIPATKEQCDQLKKAMADAGYKWDAEKKELKKIEQKPAWSEEDENILNEFVASLKYSHEQGYNRQINWLKSLKNRVKLQLNQEWSEEGKARINKIIDVLDWEDYVCYVKSLKPQNTWKPSDGQIKQLGWVAEQNKDNMIGKELMTLYNDLKKLREE